jgi:hypothetical protein
MKTTVINLFAGPGVGKSTVASELYSVLKKKGEDVELVREYVKDWAWEGKVPGKFDQPYIFGKQLHLESRLYGKVRFIITDSPFLFSPFYEKISFGTQITLEAAKLFTVYAQSNGVSYINFFIARHGKYNKKGRFQTEKQARKVDADLLEFLRKQNLPIFLIDSKPNKRVENILEKIK